jgi:diguanylate cyclase (GGDEF)-like protein/PAS domain S-box-containing protein
MVGPSTFFQREDMGTRSKHSGRWKTAATALVAVTILGLAPGIASAEPLASRYRTALTATAILTLTLGLGWVFTARRMKRTAATESLKFSTLLDAAPEVVIGVDDRGLIRFANAHVRELFGYGQAELVGSTVELLIPERFRGNHLAHRQRYAEQPQRRPMGSGLSLVGRRRDGSEVPVEISLSRMQTREGHLVLCIIRDVTEQTRTRNALLESNARLKASLAETGRRASELRQLRKMSEFLQCCITEAEVHAVMARAIARLTPETCGGLYLLNASRNLVELAGAWGEASPPLNSVFEPQACWAMRRARSHSTRLREPAARCTHCDPRFEGVLACIPVAAHGETIGVLCIRLPLGGRSLTRTRRQLLRAVAEQGAVAIASLRLRDALRMQSTRDALTGLYNRRFLDECLEREVTASLRTHAPLSVLMLDLDHFKRFNDTFGHQCGDHALRDVAATVNRVARRSDIPCRFGGEELVMLLPGTTLEGATVLAEKLRDEVQQLVIRHNDQLLGGITLSIGIAATPAHGHTPAELLRAADAALYSAKRGGRNRVFVAPIGAEAAAAG